MNKKTILAVTIVAVLSIACAKNENEVFVQESAGMERVPVELRLETSSFVDGMMAETKTTMDPDNLNPSSEDYSDIQIHDVNVLQFNGVTGDAVLIGDQNYFDHWPLHGYDATDPLYDEEDVLKLIPTPSSPHTVVVLANTFCGVNGLDAITNGMKLSEVLAVSSSIAQLSDVLVSSGGNDYFRMSGAVCSTITASTVLNVTLKRNVAKVVIKVTNTTPLGSGAVSLSGIRMQCINSKYYYLAHLPASLAVAEPPAVFSDPYSSTNPCRFNDTERAFPAENNPGGASSGVEVTYTYYVPVNLRGEPTDNTLDYNKGKYAPNGATFFRIYGSYGTGTPVSYTYYPGSDLKKNFDLLPNHKYTFVINISQKGDSRYDCRVEDMAEEVFYTDANCYMLHPPEGEGQSRFYAIPVRRAAVFWNPEGVNMGVYGACNLSGYEDLTMDANTPWTAEVVWSDFDMSEYMDNEQPEKKFLHMASGTGFDPADPTHLQPYIKVKVPNGMEGNVVVGVKKGDIILWSWHLWITDYNPDVPATPETDKFIYEAINGQIHRYNNDLWRKEATETAVGYAKGFIMDRNLGAMGTAYSSTKGLYYQAGRKDPFNIEDVFYYGGTSYSTDIRNAGGAYARIRYTVNHPDTFLRAGQWTSNEDLGPGGYHDSKMRWYDRNFLKHVGNQNILELKKSIYDPCPPGWAIPEPGVFSDFTKADPSTQAAGTYTTRFADNGRYYYPMGYVNASQTGAIFFPAAGTRLLNSYHPSAKGSSGYYWQNGWLSGSYYDYYFAYTYFDADNMAPDARGNGLWNNYSGHGYSVRCVRE